MQDLRFSKFLFSACNVRCSVVQLPFCPSLFQAGGSSLECFCFSGSNRWSLCYALIWLLWYLGFRFWCSSAVHPRLSFLLHTRFACSHTLVGVGSLRFHVTVTAWCCWMYCKPLCWRTESVFGWQAFPLRWSRICFRMRHSQLTIP